MRFFYQEQYFSQSEVHKTWNFLELSNDEKDPELVLDSVCQDLAQFENYDVEFWLERALKRNGRQRMVKYTTNVDQDSFLIPKEFKDNYHDGYQDLGVEISLKKRQEDDLYYLPITSKGEHSALLLDRDGVINRDSGYLFQYEDVVWMEGIVPLIKYAQKVKAKVVVLTNQSGIGRNFYNIDQMHELHKKMHQQLLEWGCHIDEWLYCPYHSEGVNEFKGYSLLRKPYPAMGILAQESLKLDLKKSIMIGDKKTDRLNDLDIKTIFLRGNYQLEGEENVLNSHLEIVEYLKKINWP